MSGDRAFEPAVGKSSRITWRAVLLGILCTILNTLLILFPEVVEGMDISYPSIIIPAITLLFFITLFNALAQRFAPRCAFSQAELLTVYIMMVVSTGVACVGMSQHLVPSLAVIHHYADNDNRWVYHAREMPDWFILRQRPEGFFRGKSSIPWAIWWRPLILWGVFMLVVAGAMYAVMAVFRKSWVERERLTFPITYLPMEMTRDSRGFLSNKLMWIGFLLPVVIELLNAFNQIWPFVPAIPVAPIRIDRMITGRPWQDMGYTVITFWPFVIGIAYFLTANVSFSCWFFYLLRKAQNIFASAVGWREEGAPQMQKDFPFNSQQNMGGILGLAVFCVWIARGHIAAVFKKAVFGGKDIREGNEPISYRGLVVWSVGLFAVLVIFSRLAGLSILPGVLFFLLYFAIMLVMARLRAEAGSPWTMTPALDPGTLMREFAGNKAFSIQDMSVMSFLVWMTGDTPVPLSANYADAMKMSSQAEMDNRRTTVMSFLAIALAVAISLVVIVWIYHAFGAATAKINADRVSDSQEAFKMMATWGVEAEGGASIEKVRATGLAFIFTVFLFIMRGRYLWWPFHPVGYVMSTSEDFDIAFVPVFVGWLLKTLVIRYGGAKTYKNSIMFFVGMIIGHMFIALLIPLIGLALNINVYSSFTYP